MNVFINTMYLEYFHAEGVEKRFPLIYFWLKDYYYQKSADNFSKVNWSYNDDEIPIRENKKLQQQLFDNPPDIVGLSMYMWNEELLLDNARWIKQNFPNSIIVGGGPNADSRKEFLSQNQYIDLVIPGPGAESFRRIIDNRLDNNSILDVAGVCYWDGNSVIKNKPPSRKEDPLVLDFVTNFRDEVDTILEQYKDYCRVIWTTIYIQGCPYSCSFCEQGTKLWTKINTRDEKKIYAEVDLLKKYDNIVIEFADANFGIVPMYEVILDYIIENSNDNIKFRKPPLAKNRVEFTSYLMKKMIDSGIYDNNGNYHGQLSLQDPNPEIVKMNGRPFAKEYEKIKQYQKFTQDDEHKTGKIDIIIGMPGQSYNSLTDSLHELLKINLLSNFLPHWYLVFPNTTLTSEGNTYKFKDNKCYIRSEKNFHTSFLDRPSTKNSFFLNYMIETETLSTAEFSATWYHWSLMCHLYGFMGWIRTPINYLQNYHGIDSHTFIREYTKQFHPNNWHNLPTEIRLDLEAHKRWLLGMDKFYDRYDVTGKFPINPKKVSQYRFHTNSNDFLKILYQIFSNLIDVDNDPMIKDLFAWQKSKILKFDSGVKNRKKTLISYNFDDLSFKQDKEYYKSIFEFIWPEEDLYKNTTEFKEIPFIPSIVFKEIQDKNLQQRLILN